MPRRRPSSTLFPYTTLFRSLTDPDVGGVVAVMRDICERKELEAQLRHQAFHDPLTGLPNRTLFMHRVDLAFRSEEHTSELQSRENLVCRLLLEKKKKTQTKV